MTKLGIILIAAAGTHTELGFAVHSIIWILVVGFVIGAIRQAVDTGERAGYAKECRSMKRPDMAYSLVMTVLIMPVIVGYIDGW